MKKIAHWLLLGAAFCMPTVLRAQEDDAPEQAAESAEAADKGAVDVDAAKSRLAELDKQVAELKGASATFTSRYERYKKDVEDKLKKVEESQQKVSELSNIMESYVQNEYTFSVIRDDERTKFEEEGGKLVSEITALLRGREHDQITGIARFDEIREGYQGAPGYPEAFSLYKKLVDKYEKKWTATKESLTKARQKYNAATKQKVEDADQSGYKRQEQRMEAAGKDISRDWFVPSSATLANMQLLDVLIQRVRSSKRYAELALPDEAGKVPEMLKSFWEVLDSAVAKMREGQMNEALELLGECPAYQALSSVSRSCMPDELKQDIRNQYQELRNDVRKRANEVRNQERSIQREKTLIEREMSNVDSRLESIDDALQKEKEDIARREEEAAEKAAEEAERKAEEEAAKAEEEAAKAEEEAAKAEAAADDEEEAAEKPAKKKSKKRKKKSAEKKAEDSED